MRIVSIGGGPAGLYFAILMKQADPSHEIIVVERNGADDTFGFGVVFSDATLDNFRAADRETHTAITQAFAHWDDIDTHYGGQILRSTGHGFAGMSRQALLTILQLRRARRHPPLLDGGGRPRALCRRRPRAGRRWCQLLGACDPRGPVRPADR